MFRGLGHLVRSVFGRRRRKASSAPDDTLRRAMDAAAVPRPEEAHVSPPASQPWPLGDDRDLPTLFLHGKAPAAAALASAAPEAEPEPLAEPQVKPRVKSQSKPRSRPATLPADAVWLTDAVVWSQCGVWRQFWLPPTDPQTSACIAGFIARAASGDLEVWGRLPGDSRWKPIKPGHWKKARLDPLAFLQGRENAFSLALPPRARDPEAPPRAPVKYEALMVSRAAVEAQFGQSVAAAIAPVSAVA